MIENIEHELGDVVFDAINRCLQDHGGGMIEAFIGMVDFIDTEGDHRFAVFALDDQLQIRSFSLAQYMYARELEIQRLNIHQGLLDDEEET